MTVIFPLTDSGSASMIISCIRGGLGNQLFQYAFARFIAAQHDAELRLNVWWYTSSNPNLRLDRRFELSNFDTSYQQLCEDNWHNDEMFILGNNLRFVKDVGQTPGEIIALGDNLILSGSTEWAEGKHLGYLFTEPFRTLLRRELRLKCAIEDCRYNHFKSMIDHSSNSVGVHIRQGDYKNIQHIFALLNEDYYMGAFSIIEAKTVSPEYFIFSDEIEWVENNFHLPQNVHFVKTATAIGDFELLRRCRHIIMANSTFSWWAAYLNDNFEKIVVMPAKYYAQKSWQSEYEKDTEFTRLSPNCFKV
jgi:hypothetical protein